MGTDRIRPIVLFPTIVIKSIVRSVHAENKFRITGVMNETVVFHEII